MANRQEKQDQPEDEPETVELFCLELDHQFETRIKPALKAALDRKQEAFDTEHGFNRVAAARPAPAYARSRPTVEPDKKSVTRPREPRQQHRTLPETRPGTLRDLADSLARTWNTVLVLDARLRPTG